MNSLDADSQTNIKQIYTAAEHFPDSKSHDLHTNYVSNPFSVRMHVSINYYHSPYAKLSNLSLYLAQNIFGTISFWHILARWRCYEMMSIITINSYFTLFLVEFCIIFLSQANNAPKKEIWFRLKVRQFFWFSASSGWLCSNFGRLYCVKIVWESNCLVEVWRLWMEYAVYESNFEGHGWNCGQSNKQSQRPDWNICCSNCVLALARFARMVQQICHWSVQRIHCVWKSKWRSSHLASPKGRIWLSIQKQVFVLFIVCLHPSLLLWIRP